ncbi:hypothetical protein [Streptomyces rishiriensis]|uniref:Septal ring factor EnvC (AmiA/AmiB activator) n=1 Tax=Streptomyces rishiriensis TaxID=68264 RepID=A0ABU0NYX0_STRRH|nr:hypothetical protein [Streptomyces rishiriensis]MDQ0583630.1 septal ring factor EnvC (AmiA/AmiB activator) [Streptomyces rishiriensis]
MYEYEVQQARSAELRRRADHARLAREAVRSRRAARREAAERATAERADGGAGSESHTHLLRRLGFARPA